MSEDEITINGLNFVPYIKQDEILKMIQNVAHKINRDYDKTKTEGIHIIIILNGAFMFASDLVKKLNNVASINFMKVSSYKGTKSTGNIKIDLDLNFDIKGKDILIVEDIIDTGLTMDTLCNMLQTRNPKSINICTMLLKTTAFMENIANHNHYPSNGIKYIMTEIDNKFVIGYGLDLDHKARDLEHIYILKN